MGVLTPERTRTRPPPEPPAGPPPEPPRRGNPWPFLTVLLVILALVGGFMWVRGLVPEWDNPFSSRAVDRSQPALLVAVRDVGDFHAAAGDYQVLVDLENDTDLPSEILGTRTLFVARGSVDAGVDLSQLGEDAVVLSDDGEAATITLPHARLYDAQLDLGDSYTYERDEGLLNRIGGVFSGGDEYEREAMLAAEEKLDEAARANGDLLRRAEENTAAMLRTLAASLGYERVDVRFE